MMNMFMSLFLYLVLVVFSLVAVAFYTLMERRILGNFHLRMGPFMVGPMGYFQPFSDAVKLFVKSNSLLRFSYIFLWGVSPILALLMYIYLLISFPFGGGEVFFNSIFLLFICMISFSVYFLVFGGYYSGSKYSLLGSYRAVVQMISYEVVLIFLFITYFFLIGGWNYGFKLYEYTNLNFWFCLPFLAVWLIVILAETNRLPYDFLEGESELVSGFNTEYWGGYFSFLFIYEYGCMILFGLITGVLLFSGFMVFFVFLFVLFGFLWMRATCPRFRYDMLMNFVWKKLLVLSLSFFCYFIFV